MKEGAYLNAKQSYTNKIDYKMTYLKRSLIKEKLLESFVVDFYFPLPVISYIFLSYFCSLAFTNVSLKFFLRNLGALQLQDCEN